MKKMIEIALCSFAACIFLLAACTGTGVGGSTQTASVIPAPSANSENDAQGGKLVGKEILPTAPAPGDGLYEKICRCLYPYLITQSTTSGYPLFKDKDGQFAAAEYDSLLNYLLLQEHAKDAVKTETASDGQTIFYFLKKDYETWYAGYYPSGPLPDEQTMQLATVDGQACAVLTEKGYGSVTTFTIEAITQDADWNTVIEVRGTSTEFTEKIRLKFTVKIEEDGFTYIKVE